MDTTDAADLDRADMQRLAGGHDAALNDLMARHARPVFQFLCRMLGNEDDAKLDAIRCIDIGGGCGYIVSPGCDLPFNVPERNLAAVAAMVHDRYEREVAKRTIIARSAAACSN